MSDYSASVAIMFPSGWPSNLPDAHCTILYLGEIGTPGLDRDTLDIAINRLRVKAPGEVPVTGLDLFGPEKDVLVALLDPTKLQPIRDSFERTLGKVGIRNASQYNSYRPHVTIQEDYDGTLEEAQRTIKLPSTVALSAPALWWGDDH